VVPASLQKELDNSRASTDFFLATLYLGFAYGLIGVALLIIETAAGRPLDWVLVFEVLVSIIAVPWMSYRLAIWSTTYWASTVQAMVNLGRVPLAKALGLRLPDTMEDERRMWERLTTFVFYPYAESSARALDPYRLSGGTAIESGEHARHEPLGAPPHGGPSIMPTGIDALPEDSNNGEQDSSTDEDES
jgi:hypothetical protein